MQNPLPLKKLIFLISLGFFFTACTSNVEEELEPIAEISFKAKVKPIIDGSCISCHSPNGNILPDLTSYAKIKANTAIVKSEVESRDMPRGSTLTETQIKTIVDWVNQGALDN